MIPIHDDNPTRRIPWLTIVIIAANIIVFLYEVTRNPGELSAFIDTWAFHANRFFAQPTDPHQGATLVSSMFIHAGWLHLGANMLYLWIFGNNVEDRLGRVRFALFFLACGLAAALVQGLAAPTSALPQVGASGAIAGVLGAYLLLYPSARVITVIPIFFFLQLATLPAVFVIGAWFLVQLAQGVGSVSQQATAGGVAWWAHIGGFVAGMLLGLVPAVMDARRPRRR